LQRAKDIFVPNPILDNILTFAFVAEVRARTVGETASSPLDGTYAR
jgi:hypothetical protein